MVTERRRSPTGGARRDDPGVLIHVRSSRFQYGDIVRVPHEPAGTADVRVVRTGLDFAFRRKLRVEKDGVQWEIDEDVAELVTRPPT